MTYLTVLKCFGIRRSRTFKNSQIVARGLRNKHFINTKRFMDAPSQISSYWIDRLKMVEKFNSVELIDLISTDNPLGFSHPQKTSNKPTLLNFYIQQKILHPQKIIIMRVGEFYETYGIDSIMLVEYAGLNAMGGKCKAGCPINNIQSTLDALTDEGLSIAMYEELPDVELKKSGKTPQLKTRALSQIVSPASRTYIHGLAMKDDKTYFRANRPIVGITQTHSGYTLCALYMDEKKVMVMERLTPEAVRTLYDDIGHIEPIYLQGDGESLSFLREVVVEKVSGYSEAGFLQHVLRKTGDLFELASTHDIAVHKRDYQSQPRPVYTNTAMQIGLLPNDYVPSLVDFLLPRGGDSFSHAFWSRWLISPPPHDVADHMQRLNSELYAQSIVLPHFTPVSLGKVVSFLSAGEASVALFRHILCNAQNVSAMLTTSTACPLSRIVEPLLAITSYQSDVFAGHCQLLSGCDRVVAAIEAVIQPAGSIDPVSTDPLGRVPQEFFRRNEEPFRGRVLSTHSELSELYADISKAAQELCAVVNEDLGHTELVHDILNNSLVGLKNGRKKTREEQETTSDDVTAVTEELTSVDIQEGSSVVFTDRKGRLVESKTTTKRVIAAIAHYVKLTDSAPLVVKGILRGLSEIVSKDLVAVQQATHWAVIAKAADAHVASARQKQWCLPDLASFSSRSGENDGDVSSEATPLQLVGLSPFWLDRHSAVRNDVSMRGMFFLTAPNMSGKSTLIRSVLAIALLANCGLFVPCTSAVVPRYDNFFLRTTGYDVPKEGKSAFAVEMDDMRVVLRDVSRRSLVMIDELGKGTSSHDGASLSGALLEELVHRKLHGIFATHLHEMLQLPLCIPGVEHKRMSVEVQGGRVECTYTLQDGTCTDSLALITARQYGIDENVVRRAEELGLQFDKRIRGAVTHSNNSVQNSLLELLDETGNISQTSSLNVFGSNLGAVESYDLSRDIKPLLVGLLSPGSNSEALVVIDVDRTPPASLEGQSCLYVLHIHKINCQSRLYVGETESIRQRLDRHRSHFGRDGWKVECLVLPVTVGGKSSARKLETSLIKKLKQLGFYLDSSSDERHSLFGSA